MLLLVACGEGSQIADTPTEVPPTAPAKVKAAKVAPASTPVLLLRPRFRGVHNFPLKVQLPLIPLSVKSSLPSTSYHVAEADYHVPM